MKLALFALLTLVISWPPSPYKSTRTFHVYVSPPYKPARIFDVHVHGTSNVRSQLSSLTAAGVQTLAVSTSQKLQQQYKSNSSLTILHGLMLPCPNGRVPYSQQGCFDNGQEWPALQWVDSLARLNKIQFLGEVLSQYHGISMSDPALFPYYRLAEQFQLPIGIHTGSAGPNHGCPNFKEELGDPLLLKPLLDSFPRAHVWIMHAGGPYLSQTIKLMKNYPNLYTDISAVNNPDILPFRHFAEMMQSFINNGLEDRIMFGSDNADITISINSISSLSFLTAAQKDKIFYKNAERFFNTSK